MSIQLKSVQLPFLALAALAAVGLAGCGSSGAGVHPVKGQVQLIGGDPSQLAGHIIEIVKEDDQHVRASGEIQPDGNFQLETLEGGKILRGAAPGKYKARIVLSDDDPQARKTVASTIDPRVLKFESSDLALEVPAKGPVELQIKRR
jgi:hypothetical protein